MCHREAVELSAVDGDALALVRPYRVAHEERQQRRRPRRALVMATTGVDFLPEVPR
ncbi:hypothetical protein ACQUSR_24685 [Streptomyces sp. P1-3]|uniref:hypothetical protein n=1 Tax=Streptomyces sp. P1-3 TaxID=3421658 RepID=UPI003D36729F